jgi:hypothetical protein
VTRSITDADTTFPYSDFTGLKVTIPNKTTVRVTVKPTAVWNEADVIRFGSGDLLTVSRAVFGWYPKVSLVRVTVLGEFTDTYGKTTTDAAGWLEISKRTASKFDYEGMRFLPSSLAWCAADSYWVHPAIWKALNDGDRGCMVSPSK